MCSRAGLFWIVFHLHGLHLVLGIVGDDHFHRIDYGHDAGGYAVEVLAHGVL